MGKGSGRGGDDRQAVRGGDSLSLTDSVSLESHTYSLCLTTDPSCWPKGLQNVGNTCYANAALQCLLSTALPHALLDQRAAAIFRRYSSNSNLLQKGTGSVDSADSAPIRMNSRAQREAKRQRDDKRMKEKCRWLTQNLREITVEYSSSPQKPSSSPTSIAEWLRPQYPVVDPGTITKHPDRLSQCLRPYQQEDAHEFLRALLGTLTMNGQNKTLSSLFDGLLESAVTCLSCGAPSLTRDRYMDISLDIHASHVETLTDALKEFTKAETLSGDNKVHCSKCDCKRPSTKELRLATAPSILVCHLKRFAFNSFGEVTRIGKKVDFPLRIEIGDFMSRVNKARPPPYELVAVLVHQGQSCEHGHYIAFVKKNGEWYKCNDSQVTQVDVSIVLSQQAYILLYEVAGMRQNHGYPSPDRSKRKRSQSSSSVESSILSSFLCGLDDSFLDLCCQMSKPVTEHRHRAQDDLSTLGESTVDSSVSRLRRSVSSGNIVNAARNGMHSAPRATQRFEAQPQRRNPDRVPLSRRSSSVACSDPGTSFDIIGTVERRGKIRKPDRGSLPPRPR